MRLHRVVGIIGLAVASACGGRMLVTSEQAEVADPDAGDGDASSPSVVGESDAAVIDADASACVRPARPSYCAPPGGEPSSPFDPAACLTDGGASCSALCSAWFHTSPEATFCAPAEWFDGSTGWLVCDCNVP